MALITCPECGKQVSSEAKTCPVCGYPIAAKCSTKIRIKIDPNPDVLDALVTIYNHNTNEVILRVHSGSVAEFESDKPVEIEFVTVMRFNSFTTVVEPGKKYHAVYGAGLLNPRISACHEVDVIDS